MNFECYLGEYLISTVIISCYIIGYIIKNYTKIPNKYIPLIMIFSGMILNFLRVSASGEIYTLSVFISGAVSGLATTGINEFMSKSLGLGDDNND